MKILSALSALLLLRGAAAQQCPNSIDLGDWTEVELNDGDLTLFYAVVLGERGIFCARLESEAEHWVGFAISPCGKMECGNAILGLPDDNTVLKYWQNDSKKGGGVTEMEAERQTLMSTSITQDGGRTVMEFTKYLFEDGENEINPNGLNTFLWAVGSSNDLVWHQKKGSFEVMLDVQPSAETDAPTPSGSNAQGNQDQNEGSEETAPGLLNTISPTPAAIERGDPIPDPPVGNGATGDGPTPADSTPGPPVDTPEPPSVSTPEPPAAGVAQPTPTPPSGAVDLQIGTLMLGVGVMAAVWFGM